MTSAFALISSVLPPGTDLRGGASEGPNLTQSGHSGSHPITEHASREADQDWSQDRPPRAISHVPIGRGRGAEGTVPEYPEPD